MKTQFFWQLATCFSGLRKMRWAKSLDIWLFPVFVQCFASNRNQIIFGMCGCKAATWIHVRTMICIIGASGMLLAFHLKRVMDKHDVAEIGGSLPAKYNIDLCVISDVLFVRENTTAIMKNRSWIELIIMRSIWMFSASIQIALAMNMNILCCSRAQLAVTVSCAKIKS